MPAKFSGQNTQNKRFGAHKHSFQVTGAFIDAKFKNWGGNVTFHRN